MSSVEETSESTKAEMDKCYERKKDYVVNNIGREADRFYFNYFLHLARTRIAKDVTKE